MKLRTLTISASLLLAVTLGANASALTNYTDVFGTDVDYTGINENSNFGDPEPLFGQPTGFGNSLLFFPTGFSASSAGGGVDQTGSLLNLTITATGGSIIDDFSITEFGDTALAGVGTNATGSFIQMSGFLTVTETLSGPIAPVVIPFAGVFAPTDTFDLVANPGTSLWSATVNIDVTAFVADATVAELQLNNNLFAFSEATTSATVEKKVVSGPSVIITVPEPATAALLGLGLLALGGARRRLA